MELVVIVCLLVTNAMGRVESSLRRGGQGLAESPSQIARQQHRFMGERDSGNLQIH
jgi:hypothetical protein